MQRLHRAILGLVIVPLALASCANTPSVDPGAGGSDGGAPGQIVPGSPGSVDQENPVDRIHGPATCDMESPSGSGSDGTVASTPCPGDPQKPISGASPVTPTPGMAGVYARGWDAVDVSADDMRLTLTFVSGLEPCSVLDHVDVSYGSRTVTVTLYEGHDPAAGDVACAEIGVFKKVTVDLSEPLGGRSVTDGVR